MALKPAARACSLVLVCFLGATGSVAKSSMSAPGKIDVLYFVHFGI